MAEDKRTGWLRELKVGDYVFVNSSGWRGTVLAKVEKITPTGRIVTDNTTFGPDGFYHVDRFRIDMLQQATEKQVSEYLAKNQKKLMSNKICSLLKTDWENIDYELLKEFYLKLFIEKIEVAEWKRVN